MIFVIVDLTKILNKIYFFGTAFKISVTFIVHSRPNHGDQKNNGLTEKKY